MTPHSDLSRIFHPRSIAVVGASATAGKIGAMPITLLRKHGYPGRLIPVNPRGGLIQGLAASPDLAAVDGPLDLAILAVPAEQAAAVLAQASPGQIGGAVVFTSGYAETGTAGRARQAELAEVARARGIRLLGPNCLGFMNVREQVYATFSPAPMNGAVPPGHIGMVSQSGAFGAYAYSMARERGLGLSYWISTGNETDLDTPDCIAWLVDDPHTRVIMVYMEGCRDGAKLRRALAAARAAGKPVVVAKIGRTAAGAQAAASHTAALAGDDAVYDALFRQYGVVRAQTVDEFFNLGYALGTWPARPAGRRLGIITISGGVGALMADEAHDAGLELPEPDGAVAERLIARVPFASARNPVDVTGQAVAEPGLLLQTAEDMLAAGTYDALAVFLAAAGSLDALWPTFETFVRELRSRHPQVMLALSAIFPPQRRQALEALGCPVFADPSAVVRALGAAARLQQAAAPDEEHAVAPPPLPPLPPRGSGTLNEVEGLALLRQAGIPAADASLAASADQAAALAQSMGGPVVLKIVSRDILHKSDMGGVKLALQGCQEVRQAHAGILASVARLAPQARIEGVLVAPMAPPGVECILGMHRDPVFGPVIMFGLGGVYVEILRDVSFRLAPLGRAQALEMIAGLKAYPLLRGARGGPACDLGALADAIVALGRLAHAGGEHIDSIDINPLLALPQGQGVLALDAVVAARPAE